MTPIERVYPAPRELRLLDGGGSLHGTAHTPVERTMMEHPGEYSISFDGNTVHVYAGDDDGETSARSVLRQLATFDGEVCPAFEVRDWPMFATRGFMLDVSRNRVPTMETLRELIGALSSLRMNHLQLYVEHTFAYSGHEAVWEGHSPITATEVRELDRLCTDLGITLAANQNCFGHLAEWLRHPAYADLAETHGPYDFYGLTRDGPFSLCPIDERSLQLVRGWLEQLRACFGSPLMNIGCDETADVGVGRSAEAVAQRGKSAVYAAFVSAVADAAREHGFEPMFWADIALGSPGTLERLPESLKPLAWGYEPDSPFADWDAALQQAGRVGWVCPGTSCWRTFAGRTAERKATLDAACSGHASFDGVLVTAWGDVGHQQQWPVTLHALGDAAHAAWHGRSCDDPKAASRLLFGDADVGRWLDALGDADVLIRSPDGDVAAPDNAAALKNASALFNEVFPANPALPARGSVGQWSDVADQVNSLRASLPSVSSHIDAELRWTANMSALAARVALARRCDVADGTLAADLAAAEAEYRRLWVLRSRPGGLERSCSHLGALTRSVREASA